MKPSNIMGLNAMGRSVQDGVISTLTGLFSHGPTPLENTLDHPGDPGLLGPGSISWRVLGDASVFIGGIRALIVQTAHPEVVAGVEEHSTYRDDPLGRLTRTSVYVTETTYGAMPEVEEAVRVVRQAHRTVQGTSERDRPYSARQPEMAAWVHNVLTDSFLSAFQAFGPNELTVSEADQFVFEQSRIGALLGASPLPQTADALTGWIGDHPDRAPTESQAKALGFLRNPPLSLPVRVGYRLLFNAALTTIPSGVLAQLGLQVPLGAAGAGRKVTTGLRWSLGASPSWQLSLVRCDAPIPRGLFRQPLPVVVHATAPASETEDGVDN